MISSDAFGYINLLDGAADASWQRETLIMNNIALNIERKIEIYICNFLYILLKFVNIILTIKRKEKQS